MKIAFVIQRYGQEVMGGAEVYCRLIAEKLAEYRYDITVFTTTAKDYITWKNEYPPEEVIVKGVRIKRYPVEKERDIQSFNKYSDWIFSHDHSLEEEIEWLEQQGPYCPSLIQALRKEEKDYDVFVFFTYLYYPTYWGLKSVQKRKILVPTVHDEPPLYLSLMKEVFSLPEALVFNTPAEKELLNKRFSLQDKYQDIMGVGVDIPADYDNDQFGAKHEIAPPFILYAGRIEEGKGCKELLEYFQRYYSKNPRLTLIFIGKLFMELLPHPAVKYLGFLSPEEKNSALASALVTVHPSYLESLGLAALESMAVKTPILVQEKTEPLRYHCVQGNSGLWYSNYEEFEAALDLFLKDLRLRVKLGENGLQYIKKYYSWPKVIQRYKKLFLENRR